MHLERYNFIADKSHVIYQFVSEGRNGRIQKIVFFKLIDSKKEIYNLGFGDYNDMTGKVNDLSVSNNQDRDKILATIAATVVDFTEKHPTATVVAAGSTQSRTRLYRMGVTRYLQHISAIFEIEGFKNGWEEFQIGRDYQAFSIKRKKV